MELQTKPNRDISLKTILAFMQNMYVIPEKHEKVKKSLKRWEKNPEYWNKMCSTLLFTGKNRSGNNIKAAFGELIWDITWDESTKKVYNNPNDVPEPDIEHMKTTIKRVKPDIIITFGKVAEKGINKITSTLWGVDVIPGNVAIIRCPHPTSRQAGTIAKLRETAQTVRRLL